MNAERQYNKPLNWGGYREWLGGNTLFIPCTTRMEPEGQNKRSVWENPSGLLRKLPVSLTRTSRLLCILPAPTMNCQGWCFVMSSYPRATIGWTVSCWPIKAEGCGSLPWEGDFRAVRSPGVAYSCYNMEKSNEEPQEPDSDTETQPKTMGVKGKKVQRNQSKSKKRKTPPQDEEKEKVKGQKKQKVRLPYKIWLPYLCHLLFLIDPPPKHLPCPFLAQTPS